MDGLFQVDARRVYYLGRTVDGPAPTTTRFIGAGMIRNGGKYRTGSIALNCRPHPSVTTGRSRPLLAPIGRASFDRPRIRMMARDAMTQMNATQAIEAAYRLIFALLGSVFRILPFQLDTYDLPDPVVPPPDMQLRRHGEDVKVLHEGQVVARSPESIWMNHASAFWALIYGRRDRLYFYPKINRLPPEGRAACRGGRRTCRSGAVARLRPPRCRVAHAAPRHERHQQKARSCA